MLILHAGFYRDQFYLWGESPAEAAKADSDRYPYECKHSQFPKADVLGFRATKGKFQDMALWCPTRGTSVYASSPLIAEPPTSKAKLRLAPWLLAAYPLPLDTAMPLFLSLPERPLLAPGVVIAPDLAYIARVFRLACSLVVTQNYLPGLRDEETGWFARWLPVTSGNFRDFVTQAETQMPAGLRALTHVEVNQPPTKAPAELLSQMVTNLVDALVRMGNPTRKMRTFTSIHDDWFHALQTADGRMTAPPADSAELAGKVNQWRRPIGLAARSPLRLCFRLEEPQLEEFEDHGLEQDWYVRYFLQAHEDHSLLIPANHVWSGHQLPELISGPVRYRETLLSFLGQAAGVCEQVNQSLELSAPEGYSLSNDDACQFLSQKAAVLKQFGFAVILPNWWTKSSRAKLSVNAKVTAPAFKTASGLSLDTVVQFAPVLALNSEPLTWEELELLANLKVSLVRLRGQWVEVGDQQIQTALAFLKKKQQQEITLRDLIHHKIGATQVEDGVFLENVEAEGWLGELLAQLDQNSGPENCATPEGFQGQLRPYQERGFSWLAFLSQWGLGACLADDMGLGKTVQTLSLLLRDKEAGFDQPTLLVCPVSVVGNWQQEAHKFTPDLEVLIHHGGERLKGAAFTKAAANVDLVITSFGLLQRDIRNLSKVAWRGAILDEAQHIKNANTKQAQAARSLQAQFRIALTGTPVENNVGDLWAIMEFLNPGLLGNQASFKKHYLVPIHTKQDQQAAARLKKISGPFILRRLKTDKTIISDLPDKVEMITQCGLTREQTSLYAARLQELQEKMEAAEGIERRGLILALLTGLKQVCNHPAQFLADGSAHEGRSGKLIRLEEILEEVVSADQKALLFTQYAEMGFILQKRLQDVFGLAIPFLHGGVTKKKRDEMVSKFQNSGGENPIMILSLKAGGTGLNLTAASHVIHYDRWWNPAVENQATDRAFRIGQKNKVTVHKFLCPGTVEEKIDEMINTKKQIADSVVSDGEAFLTEMSNQDLRKIFALTATPMEG